MFYFLVVPIILSPGFLHFCCFFCAPLLQCWYFDQASFVMSHSTNSLFFPWLCLFVIFLCFELVFLKFSLLVLSFSVSFLIIRLMLVWL